MFNRRYFKSLVCLLSSFAMLLALVLPMAVAKETRADDSVAISQTSVKMQENCTADFDGDALTVTDTDDNNDVWSSKLLLDVGMELTIGEQYKISFDLAGENGVGEFFLCKSENIDDRYDETFSNDVGDRSITFTAAASKLYIGVQVGNIGKGHSVTAKVAGLCTLAESESPSLLRTENCTAGVNNGVISATDTSDNNDVWNSKVLYDAGVELEIGKTYQLSFTLAGDKGVGEFFLCKSQDLNNRYDATFTTGAGSQTVTFVAASDRLYVGMQFGNLGKGNSVTATVGQVEETTPAAPPKFKSLNCLLFADGNAITVVDAGRSDDVWNSQLIYDAGIKLEEGKQYEISFTLSGDNGVGEFFLLKSKDINDRYDETFSSASGLKTVVFTAVGSRAFIGMQVGNLGRGNSVTLTISEFQEFDPASRAVPKMLVAENCTQTVTTTDEQTIIVATDTSDNNDVWNSKILYSFGEIMEAGSFYTAKFNLFGEDGVGEFFFLKDENMDHRYSFDNTAGDHIAQFKAEDIHLYAGLQFGNIGKDNEVTVDIEDIFRIPGVQKSSEQCEELLSEDAVTITDTSDNNDVWNSKAVYETGIVLEPGRTYTATFVLTGDNGVGEFFFLKDNNIDHRYSFDNTAGEHTITFTAESAALFFGIQCGNIGNGNSVTVSNIVVKAVEEPSGAEEKAGHAGKAAPVEMIEMPIAIEEPAEAEELVEAEETVESQQEVDVEEKKAE